MSDTVTSNPETAEAAPEYPMERSSRCPFAPPPEVMELAASAPLRNLPQCVQLARTNDPASVVGYWLWRFDRTDNPVPLDNFWLKTAEQALQDLRVANNPTVGRPESPGEVEFTVDPYFPKTAPTVAAELKGIAVHRGGRNRLMLDQRAEFLRDARLQ